MLNASIRREFLNSLAHDSQILKLFDLIPGVAFYIKDREGRFIALNQKTCEYCGVAQEVDALGKTDYDFFPFSNADSYRTDDFSVMESGQPILNRIESEPQQGSSDRLVVTNKIPLRNIEGKVIGIAGFSRHVDRLSGRAGTADDFAKTIDHLKKKFNEHLSTAELAKMSGMSVSQFERRFRRAFSSSPRQYLLRLRVDAASRLLTFTSRPIAQISLECGFHDHAHFTRSFKKMMNMTPLNFRKRQKGE
jgi:AraC-like DNA-binding protein